MSKERSRLPFGNLRSRYEDLQKPGRDYKAIEDARQHSYSNFFSRSLYSYDLHLHSLCESAGERDLSAIIKDRLRTKLERGNTKKLRILDLGCGKGVALAEMHDCLQGCLNDLAPQLPLDDQVDLVGLSLTDFRPDKVYPGSTNELLAKRGVRYQVGDMRFLRESLGETAKEPFDVMVAVESLRYVEPARLRHHIVKQIYRLLAQDGIALLGNTGLIEKQAEDNYDALDEVMRHLNRILNEHHGPSSFVHETEFSSTATEGKKRYDLMGLKLHKTNSPFHLPIPYLANGEQAPLHEWVQMIQRGEI